MLGRSFPTGAPRFFRLLACCAVSFVWHAAQAQQASVPVEFAITGFEVTGSNPLSHEETQRLLAPFLRPRAGMDTLQQAVAALQAALRERGHELHEVVLPPQELHGAVRLEVVSVRLGSVRIEGLALRSERNIRRALPELAEGQAPNLRRLATQTAIANLNPSRHVEVSVSPGAEALQLDATVRVTESKPWHASALLSNGGNEVSGRDRFTVAAAHTNLFGRDHQLEAAFTTSLERSSDVRQFGVGYTVPLYRQLSVVTGRFVRSDVVGDFGGFTSTGAGHVLHLSYALHLLPRGSHRMQVGAGIEDRLFEASTVSGVVVGVDRRSRPLKLTYALRTEAGPVALNYAIELAANTGGGRGNSLDSYRAEYPAIRTHRWKALRGTLDHWGAFGTGWNWTARVLLQYSPDALITGEQFGLGGMGSVRGTSVDRPIAGDSGASVSLEVQSPALAEGLRATAFADAGWIGNRDADGLQRLRSDALASVGLGLKYTASWAFASAEYARLLRGSRQPTSVNSFAPQKGDDRLYLQVGVRF